MANTSKANFPCTVYGVTVNNPAEARRICLEHFERENAEHAAKAAQQREKEISMFMDMGYSRGEAYFFAQGLTPCNSVSVFC